MASSDAQPTTQAVPPILLPEILGFVPQLLLDDIINVANNAVQDGVNGMEEFLEKWVEARAEREGGDWDSTQDVEQGLVSFQTLLEYHTDIAFDFFEAWSLRNIFAIPPDLPIVSPHQQNLDLTHTPEREKELMEELDQLRAKLDNQRRLRRMYTRAVQVSARQQKRAEERLERLSLLASPSLDVLNSLPTKVNTMFQSVTTLPPLDPADINPIPLVDSGKRQWETTKSGYLNWAVGQLLDKGAVDAGEGSSAINTLIMKVEDVGKTESLRAAIVATGVVTEDLQIIKASGMDVAPE